MGGGGSGGPHIKEKNEMTITGGLTKNNMSVFRYNIYMTHIIRGICVQLGIYQCIRYVSVEVLNVRRSSLIKVGKWLL